MKPQIEFCEVFVATDNAHGKVELFKRKLLPQIAPSADEVIEKGDAISAYDRATAEFSASSIAVPS